MKKNHLNYLIALSAIAAIVASQLNIDNAFMVLKPLTTILIILIVVKFSEAGFSNLTTMTAIALIACLGGDVFLMKEQYFVYGLGSFLIAQLLFTFIFYKFSNGKLYFTPLLILIAVGAFSYRTFLPMLGDLAIPVAIYNICILLMCWLGVNACLSRRDTLGLSLAIAAVLFVFSDTMIAVNKFVQPFDLSSVLILSTYWLSISIIANAVSGSFSKTK